MNDMTDLSLKERLLKARGVNRGLCHEAEQKIGELVQALIDIEADQLLPKSDPRSLKEPLLKHVQRALYSPETFSKMYMDEKPKS